MFATARSVDVRGGGHNRRLSRQMSTAPVENPQMAKPGGGGGGGGPPGGRDSISGGIRRSSSISSAGGGGGGGGVGGRMLSLSSMSESVRSGLSCFLSEQAQEQEERQQRSSQLAELQRLREVRAAAQLKILEDFLKMTHVSLRECVSYTTAMRYR